MGNMKDHPAILNLFVKPDRGQPMQTSQQLQAVAGKGLVGDFAFGRTNRQVLLVDERTLKKFDLKPGMLRENITVHNLPVDELAPGTTLAIGAVLLQVSGPCDPCYKMDRIRPGLQSELQGQRGVLATVVTSGRIAVGDTISVQAS
jgi:hypothetical protein